jgi:tetratricopeptide (TPR) repeat protein
MDGYDFVFRKKINFAAKYGNMAKQVDKTGERIEKVEQAFSKTELFIEKNQKIILIIVGVIVVVVLGFFGFKRFYLTPRESAAQSQMFMAEKYFEMDSLNKALNGDGNYLGFLDIIDQYGITKSANLSHYYAGICYLKKGEYEKAIEHLKKFSSSDQIVGPMALMALGDAYMELKQVDEAVKFYLEGADKKKNEFTTPVILMKAGWAYEEQGKYDKALEVYKRIKEEYPRTNEGRDMPKYIAKMEGLLKK